MKSLPADWYEIRGTLRAAARQSGGRSWSERIGPMVLALAAYGVSRDDAIATVEQAAAEVCRRGDHQMRAIIIAAAVELVDPTPFFTVGEA